MPGERGGRSKRAVALAALATLLVIGPPASAADAATTVAATTPTLPPFDPSTRGNKKYGDPCSELEDCGFEFSVCDEVMKICHCHENFVTNHYDKCGRPAGINESCTFNQQCEDVVLQTECKNDRCACMFEMVPVPDEAVFGGVVCKPEIQKEESLRTLDPAMIGVLVGMAVMFIIICVVLQLFSRARWRENRTIFNTPNPRLMNVSLLRESKHGPDRRGSRVSMRPPSRQASQQELRPHSPNAGSRRGSRSSGHSATSLRSATLRSPTTPGPTSVTVEIRPPNA